MRCKLLLFLLCSASVFAQIQGYSVPATGGVGLQVNIGPGTASANGTIVPWLGGYLVMAPQTTNYIYLDSNGSLTSTTSGFASGSIPIAIVTTNYTDVTKVSDQRTTFTLTGGLGNPANFPGNANVAGNFSVAGSGSFGSPLSANGISNTQITCQPIAIFEGIPDATDQLSCWNDQPIWFTGHGADAVTFPLIPPVVAPLPDGTYYAYKAGSLQPTAPVTVVPPVIPIRNVLASGGSSGSPSVQLLSLPTFALGNKYFGTAGARQHASWVVSKCNDATNALYVFKNTGGDIPAATVNITAQGGAGTGACANNGTVTDGLGTWTNQKIGNFLGTNITTDGANNTTFTTAATINTATVGLANSNKVLITGCTAANNLPLNNTVLTVTTVNANSFVGTGYTATAYNTNDSCQAYVTTNYNTFMADEFGLYMLPLYNGVRYECPWSANDSGTYLNGSLPIISFATCDALLGQWPNDVNWTQGIVPKKVGFDISHINSPAGVNGQTPSYVATQSYANTIKNSWQPGTLYLWHQYIWDGTRFQQMTGTGASAACVSGTATPAFTGGTITEASGLPPCSWTFVSSTNAPPQEYVTCANYGGDSTMVGLGNGVWTIANTTADHLSTAFPIPWETEYQNAQQWFDGQVLQHYALPSFLPSCAASNICSPDKLWFIIFGEAENGQSFPFCGTQLQTSTSTSGGNWNRLWTSMVHQHIVFLANQGKTLGLPNGFLQISPQSSNSATDAIDPTALADAEALDAFSQQPQLSTGYDGALANDRNAFGAGSPLAGDWGVNTQQYCSLALQCYLEMQAPGSCTSIAGTGGRMDWMLQFAEGFGIRNIGMFAQDGWVMDPNSVYYSQCGPAYLAAVKQFQQNSPLGAISTRPLSLSIPPQDYTKQQAAIPNGTVYTVPANGGQYLMTWNAKVTQAATTSSQLGPLTVKYTDADNGVQTITIPAFSSAGAYENNDAGNTTTTVLEGLPITMNAKGGSVIQLAFAYTSVGATPMLYNFHFTLEAH